MNRPDVRHSFLRHGWYCKKYEVNAAHNPQRTSAQMKEDGTRRRAIELLLTELYEHSSQMDYRHNVGSELTNDIWEKFKQDLNTDVDSVGNAIKGLLPKKD